MRTTNITFAAIAFLLSSTFAANAQNLNAAYFLEGYSYQHEMNPAFMGKHNYITMPMLGNVSIAMQSNVGVDNFIFKTEAGSDYKLTTFMNQSVSANSFLKNLHDNNRTGIDVKTTIFGVGFYAFKGFNTIDINFKASTKANLPYELFDFMKSGMKAAEGTTYNIKDLKANAASYAELAIGHAHKLSDNITFGAKIKFLFGVAYLNSKVDNLIATMSEGKWAIRMNGKINASMKGASFKTKQEELTQRQINANKNKPGTYIPHNNQFNGFDVDSPGLGGFGMAADLGLVCDLNGIVNGMKLSVGLLDLGFISWKNNLQASNNGNKGFEFNGFRNIDISSDGTGKTVEDQFEDLSDQFEEMLKFYDNGDQGKRSTRLTTTMNLGLEIPFSNNLSTGLLSSTHFQDVFTWTEVRLALNASPGKWLDVSASIAQSTFGTEVGGVINFHPKGINFFVGTNRIFTRTTKEFIPIKGNANFTFGLNFTFGKTQNEKTISISTPDVIANK